MTSTQTLVHIASDPDDRARRGHVRILEEAITELRRAYLRAVADDDKCVLRFKLVAEDVAK